MYARSGLRLFAALRPARVPATPVAVSRGAAQVWPLPPLALPGLLSAANMALPLHPAAAQSTGAAARFGEALALGYADDKAPKDGALVGGLKQPRVSTERRRSLSTANAPSAHSLHAATLALLYGPAPRNAVGPALPRRSREYCAVVKGPVAPAKASYAAAARGGGQRPSHAARPDGRPMPRSAAAAPSAKLAVTNPALSCHPRIPGQLLAGNFPPLAGSAAPCLPAAGSVAAPLPRGPWQHALGARPMLLPAAAHSSSAQAPEAENPKEHVRKGALVEFEKERGRHATGVVVGMQGKKNWLVVDQFGTSSSVRPQQITFVAAPSEADGLGPAEFQAADLVSFLASASDIMDDSLLELAWEELTASQAPGVTTTELAALLFGRSGAVECYACHRMLAVDSVFFKQKRSPDAVYEPRSADQVDQLRIRAEQERLRKEEQATFAAKCRAACKAAWGHKPSASAWRDDAFAASRLDSTVAYALDRPGYEKQPALEFLAAAQTPQNPAAALNLLINMGVLPRHVHSHMLEADVPLTFPPAVTAAAEAIAASPPPDPDRELRRDLTHLRVYMIDSADTVEVDDGLSAEMLPDGRLKVWIHVADPSRWITLDSALDRTARERGTSVYLPHGIVPMVPFALAAGPMSLGFRGDNGREADAPGQCAVSVGVVLRDNGSVESYEIVPSFIDPTYRITFEDVPEMLALASGEEPGLVMLLDAARKREQWRRTQGSKEMYLPLARVKVANRDDPDPAISITVEDQSDCARRLVSEMMVLCGEVVADFGAHHGLALPYRGQQATEGLEQAEEELRDLSGPALAAHMRLRMSRGTTNCRTPMPHAALGLPGYVQFTSPIRRYGDLVAHFQVKAVLRGEEPPISEVAMERIMLHVGGTQRNARKAEGSADKYWLLEHIRRLPPFTRLDAVMLRWLKPDGDPLALVYLPQIGFETAMQMTRRVPLGEHFAVVATQVVPAAGLLRLAEAAPEEAEGGAALGAPTQSDRLAQDSHNLRGRELDQPENVQLGSFQSA